MTTIKDKLIGDYDYSALCMPTLPFFGSKQKRQMVFYAKDEPLPYLVSVLMGLQHAFAMVGGLITPPFVVFKFTVDFMNSDLQQYAISAALITSGICTLINVAKIPFPFKIFGRQLYVGSGLLSVMGTSFTFLPIYEIAIREMKIDGLTGTEAYGKMLGTSMLCAILEAILSIMPMSIISKLFPPIVSGVAVTLIGVALTGTGMKYWGGGVVCAEMGWKEHSQLAGLDVSMIPSPICTNGEVSLGYGSAQFIGLGFAVMIALIIIELFGSTFMKNCNVILGLLFGYLIAALSSYEGLDYVDSQKIEDAKAITFLWVETFPLGIYAPAIIPLLIAYLVTTVETVGDLGATTEASELLPSEEEFDETIQGGLMSDAVSSVLAGLFTSMPNTTFSQNNGVIAMTKCASRHAGYACGVWLIIMGILGKISGIITSIPDCVLGGMTIFLFANVFTSGVNLLGQVGLASRRNRFIISLSMALGIGVTVWPNAFLDMRASAQTANFWRCEDCNETMKGLRTGVSIFLSTGYSVGTTMALILNLILPEDPVIIRSGSGGDGGAVDKSLPQADDNSKNEQEENDEC